MAHVKGRPIHDTFVNMNGRARPCPICGSLGAMPLKKFGRHHLVKCRECTLVYSGKEPTVEELSSLYSNYPEHTHLNPITRQRYKELLDRFSRLRSPGILLDAGCGSGFFLDVAHQNGWRVRGSEYDPNAIRKCRERGFQIWEGALTPNSFGDTRFDIITSFEVLEHLIDPIGELRIFRALLRNDGLLYMTTPNFGSISKLMAGTNWTVINYPEHLNYFTPRTLKRSLEMTGFRVLEMRTTGISPSRILSSTNARSSIREANTDPDNTDQKLRSRIEQNKYLKFGKKMLNDILTLTSTGDSIKVLAKCI